LSFDPAAHTICPIMKFLKSLTGADQLEEEKSRLEAFLAAFPGEYCGFSHDNSIAYSTNFCALLDVATISNIHDLQNALKTSDAAVLEGLFIDLKETHKPFTINVELNNAPRILRLSGTVGKDMNGKSEFYILWIEDVSAQQTELKTLQNSRDSAESECLRLQKILDTTSIPLWMRDTKTELIWCNQAYADLFETTPAAILTKQTEFQLSSRAKGQSLKDIAKKALSLGEAQTVESHIVALGRRYLMGFYEIPLPGTNWLVGMAQDMTQKEESDAQLERHLSANKTLLEQLRSGIAIYGDDQKLEFYNTAFSQLWGLEDQWLNNKPKLNDVLEKLREIRQLPEQADFRTYKKSWIDMFTRLIDAHEDMMYLPDGRAVRFLVIPHPMGGLMMIFEDVTSRLELESSYNTLIAVQKETLDNLAESVAVFGTDGRLKLSNPSYAELWGLHPEDLENKPHITKIIDRMSGFFDGQRWGELKPQLISHGVERIVKEGRLERNDDMLLEYTTVPLPDGGVLVSYFDVTDTVKVEKALREKNAALEAAEQLKTDFLANVSYQLRTPLNAIIGFAEILDNQYFGDLNERQKGYTTDIRDAGGKLVSLIDDILDLSTIEAGYLDLVGTHIDIHAMLETLNALVEEWARKEKISVTIHCDRDIGKIVADERRIKQVMLNLIRNAINFTPENGQITISAHKDETHVHLKVSDTGIGISEEDQKRIFNPFERIHQERIDMSPTALNKGAGLGLSLVKNIVELHDGSVSIDSTEGKGTNFTISLPLESELVAIE